MLLVTGASGYLGAELLRRRPDAYGACLTRPERVAPERRVVVDVRDASAVRAAFERLRPSTVIHAAYRQDDRATTLDGAAAVAEAAAALEARLVHVSTDVVFDGERDGAYDEDDEPRPLTPYGEAKAAAERMVAAAYPGALVVRTSLLYGGAEPGPQERLAADPGALFFRDELRCPTHVGDLASALLELAQLDRAGVLHVAGADVLDRLEFARLLARSQGLDPGALRSTTVAESGQLRPRNCALACDRARALLATRLRGARDVLGRSAKPMAAEGPPS